MQYTLNAEQIKNRLMTLDALENSGNENAEQQLSSLKNSGVWNLLFDGEVDWVGKVTSLIEIGKASPSLLAALTDVYLTRNILPDTDVLYASAFLEQDVDVDWSSIATTVKRDEDSIVIHGEKRFVPNVDLAEGFLVLAKDKSKDRLQIILVPKNCDGIEIEEQTTLGLEQFNFSKVTFNQVTVDPSNILKSIEDRLEDHVSFEEPKIVLAALASALAERALEDSIKIAGTKQRFGEKLGDTQNVQFKIAEMTVKINAGKSLLYQAAQKKDRNEKSDVDVAMAKVYLSEAANLAVDYNLQINGLQGLENDSLASDLYMSQRLTELYITPSEIDRNAIAEYVLAVDEF